MPTQQGTGRFIELDPSEVPEPPKARFNSAYNRLDGEFKQKFGRPLKITGDSQNNPLHNRPSLQGEAFDVRSKDLSDDEQAFVTRRASELGLHTINATGKEAWASGQHIHLDKGNTQGTGRFIELDPSEVPTPLSEPPGSTMPKRAPVSTPKPVAYAAAGGPDISIDTASAATPVVAGPVSSPTLAESIKRRRQVSKLGAADYIKQEMTPPLVTRQPEAPQVTALSARPQEQEAALKSAVLPPPDFSGVRFDRASVAARKAAQQQEMRRSVPIPGTLQPEHATPQPLAPIRRAVGSAAQSLGGAVRAIGEVAPIPQARDIGALLSDWGARQKPADIDPDSIIENLPDEVGHYVPLIATAVANPVAGVGYFALESADGFYQDVKAHGGSEAQAQNAARVGLGIGAALGTVLPGAGKAAIAKLTGRALEQGVSRGAIDALMRRAASGAGVFASQTAAQELTTQAIAPEKRTPGEMGRDVLKSAATGAVVGPVLHSMMEAARPEATIQPLAERQARPGAQPEVRPLVESEQMPLSDATATPPQESRPGILRRYYNSRVEARQRLQALRRAEEGQASAAQPQAAEASPEPASDAPSRQTQPGSASPDFTAFDTALRARDEAALQRAMDGLTASGVTREQMFTRAQELKTGGKPEPPAAASPETASAPTAKAEVPNESTADTAAAPVVREMSPDVKAAHERMLARRQAEATAANTPSPWEFSSGNKSNFNLKGEVVEVTPYEGFVDSATPAERAAGKGKVRSTIIKLRTPNGQVETIIAPEGIDLSLTGQQVEIGASEDLHGRLTADSIARSKPTSAPTEHKYSSTQVNLPDEAAAPIKRLAAQIPDSDLAEGGREDQPHVTLKYGLHGDDAEAVRRVLENEPPINARFGKTSAFEGVEDGTADAVKVDVDSPDLHRLNKKIADALPHTDTHPEYQPHATVAYVKPGLGESYSGNAALEGKEVTIDRVVFSDRDGKQTEILLQGKPPVEESHYSTLQPRTDEGKFNGPPMRETGIKNAVTLAERQTHGKPEIEIEGRRTFGQVWDSARAKIDSGEIDPGALAKSVIDHPRALNAEESAALTHDRMRLQNAHHAALDAAERAIDAGDKNAEIAARAQMKAIEDNLDQNDRAARKSGYEQGLGLAARKLIAKEDYSLARLIQRAKVATGGEVSEKTRTRLERVSRLLEAAETAMGEKDARITELEANHKIKRTIRDERATQRRTGRAATKEALTGQFAELKTEFSQWAKKALSQTNAVFDPEAVKIIAKMAKNRIRAGVNSVEALVDELHEAIKEHFADATKRDVRDALTGYGKTAEISKDEITARLRELKRQGRLISALEDAESGQRPLRSGLQRDAQSERVRELRKQVNEVMRQHGIEIERAPKDPEAQQKPALDATKTRLRNDIADITKRIETGAAAPRRTPLQYDAEATRLRTERNRLKKQLAEIEGPREISDEQRAGIALKGVERQIADLERRLAQGDFSKRQKAAPVSTPELETQRAKLETLREEYDALKPMAARNPMPAVKARLQKQIADLRGQIERGEYAKPQPRTPLVYDREAEALRATRDDLRASAEREIRRLENANRAGTEKFVDFVVKLRRAVLLSSLKTIGKLTAAATGRTITTPVEEVVGGVLSHTPGLRRIAAKAPREGGFNPRAESAALGAQFSRETLREMGAVAKTGATSLDVRYGGKDAMADPELIEVFGRLHGALKAPVKRAEFFRSLEKRAAFERKQAIAQGMTPEEADAHLRRDDVQATLGAKAYIDANRAIFMNDNGLVSAYRTMSRYFANMGEPGDMKRAMGKGADTALKLLLPIVKVPTNYVAEATSYSIGALKALGQVLAAKGVENLSPDQADYVMRNLKKQTIGAAMMALGYAAATSIGGYYQPGDNKDKEKPDEKSLRVLGLTVPKWALHTPLIEMLQIGATIRRLEDGASERGEESSTLAGIASSAKALAKEIPFVEEPIRIGEATTRKDGLQRFLGDTARSSLIPPDVQNIARFFDQTPEGEQIKRKPQGFRDELKMGIPGNWALGRGSVPLNEEAARDDLKDKIVSAGKAGNLDEARREAKAAVDSGKLSEREVDGLDQKIRLTNLQLKIKRMRPGAALEFYNALPEDQQKVVASVLKDKLERVNVRSVRGEELPELRRLALEFKAKNPQLFTGQ